jgi:salicylate hydroxylase
MAATEEMVAFARALRPHACCLVPERRQEVTTEGGLDAAGQEAALRPVVFTPVRKVVRLWNTGRTWTLFDLGEVSVARWGAPYWLIHRADLHTILAEAVEARAPGSIHLGQRATGYSQDAEGAFLHLADGTRLRGDVVLGADGVHSALRQQMAGETKARFLGVAAWRGLVPMARLPAHLQDPVGTNWVGPGGHVVTYPVRAGTLFNFGASLERDNWPVESWTEAGTHEEVLADLAGWHEDVRTIVRAIEVPFKWALLGRDPLRHYADGRVALLGDAAHAMLPFAAQGAGMAIEDAAVIAKCLSGQPANAPAAFAQYAGLRASRVARVMRTAPRNGQIYHLGGPAGFARDQVIRLLGGSRLLSRQDWIYDWRV